MRTQQQRTPNGRGRRGARRREVSVWKGLAAGVAGGLAASAAMNRFQALLSREAVGEERSHGAQSMQQGSPRQGVGLELRAEGKDEQTDDATERLANVISVKLFDHELTKREKDAAGTVFHYAMGVTSGAVYGALAEMSPGATAGAGLPFGLAVWIIADEGLVPAAGLSKSPTEYPLSVHAYSFASHLVFGLTTEVVRRAVRGVLR
ncbi:MAG: hypothetical protein QOG71_2840 [Pyrinomonadaceae bacterium]|nr:hypothetical protein [Pyrinomonadaceae bacterium]